MPSPLTSVSVTTRQRAQAAGQAPKFTPIDEQLAAFLPLYAEELALRQNAMADQMRLLEQRQAPPGMPVPPSGVGTQGDIGIMLANLGAGLMGNPALGGAPFQAIKGREEERGQVERANVLRQGEFEQQKQLDRERLSGEAGMLPAEAVAAKRGALEKRTEGRAQAMDQFALQQALLEEEARLKATYGEGGDTDNLMSGMRNLIGSIAGQISGGDPAAIRQGEFPTLTLPLSGEPGGPTVQVTTREQFYNYLRSQIETLPSPELKTEAWGFVSRVIAPLLQQTPTPPGVRAKRRGFGEVLGEVFGAPPRATGGGAPPPR